ncbi:MAG TPA: SxtJ family membrane protein [Syntrophobacteraceae bacterium]|nr:SxtJ family membrane protein [Syntrophobacteraceae bacterium]
MKDFSSLGVTREQCKDTGMAMVLLCLLGEYFTHRPDLLSVAVGLLVLDMIFPVFFKPVAVIWIRLSHVLGGVSSKLLLTLVFFLLLTPMGLIRRALGKDPMRRKQWKRGSSSVFHLRNHTFTAKDLETPY